MTLLPSARTEAQGEEEHYTRRVGHVCFFLIRYDDGMGNIAGVRLHSFFIPGGLSSVFVGGRLWLGVSVFLLCRIRSKRAILHGQCVSVYLVTAVVWGTLHYLGCGVETRTSDMDLSS